MLVAFPSAYRMLVLSLAIRSTGGKPTAVTLDRLVALLLIGQKGRDLARAGISMVLTWFP